MIAFVLGAGLGTRLRPLTERRPKPLIPVCNRPLITYAFDHLAALGVERFVVNTHWQPEAFGTEFPDAQYRGLPIAFRHEPEILETAGGIGNVADLLGDETFVVYNGDILTDLPLTPALAAHRARGNEVTLILRSRETPLQVSLDEATGAIADVGSRLHPERPGRFLFTGIYLVEPAFLRRIPPSEKISVIPIFLEMIRSGARLGGFVADEGNWWDLGSRLQYLAVHQHFAESASPPAPWIDSSAQIDATAQVLGASAIGPRATVGAGARLRDTLVWPGAEVAPGADLSGCIVTGRQRAEGVHTNTDL